MLDVTIENMESLDFLVDKAKEEALLQNILNELLTNEKKDTRKYEVDICFLTDEEIHEINAEYRDVDRPTDVISFALQDDAEPLLIDDENYPVLLGEIFVSIDKITEQATAYGHSERREFFFLLVHGFLHLLGYDHQTSEEEEEMFAKQEAILSKYNILK